MRFSRASAIFILLVAQLLFSRQACGEEMLQPYLDVLKNEGADPVEFVIEKLQDHDLIIFDDALHTAVEPFDFYQELIASPSFHKEGKTIFLEAISINRQQHIDAYLAAETEDATLLYKAFQDGFSGLGWPYKTYFDLLHMVYSINKALPEGQRIRVIGVSNPVYWSEIETKRDVELFRKTLRSHDFLMYRTIADEMGNFENGTKAIFLTNTRHAYKGIRNSRNEYYWNCGTYLHQWHPGETYSIRFHNACLHFERNETLEISWVRMGNGIWDSAFKAAGNRPVAFTLDDNAFGNEDYIGNLMLDVAPGQTMHDAYDAIIFLGPLEKMRKTAKVGFIYTDEFKKELKRRYVLLYSEEEILNELEEYGASDPEELIDKLFVAEPEKPLPQAAVVGSIDAWKGEGN